MELHPGPQWSTNPSCVLTGELHRDRIRSGFSRLPGHPCRYLNGPELGLMSMMRPEEKHYHGVA